jgi:hypothetical protein
MKIKRSILALFGAASIAAASNFNYSDSGLAFSLPGDWKKLERSTPDKLVFRHNTELFQVTVSVLNYKAETVEKKVFEKLLEDRINAEKRELSPNDSITQSEIKQIEGGYSVEFSGFDSAHERRFAGKLMMKSGLIVVVYLEGIKKSADEMSPITKVLFESLTIK